MMFLAHIHFWVEIHIWWPEWENQKASVPRFDVGKQGRCWRSWVEGHRTMFCKNTRYSTSTALAFILDKKTPLFLHNKGAGFGRYFVRNCINWILLIHLSFTGPGRKRSMSVVQIFFLQKTKCSLVKFAQKYEIH